jgi:hypothetical protein
MMKKYCKVCGGWTTGENNYCDHCRETSLGEGMSYEQRDVDPEIIARRKQTGWYEREIKRLCDEFGEKYNLEKYMTVKKNLFPIINNMLNIPPGNKFCHNFQGEDGMIVRLEMPADIIRHYRDSIK